MNIPGKYKIIIYAFYLTAAAVLFSVWLFPEDSVREFVKKGVGRVNPDISIDIGEVRPLFPPGVKFRDVALFYKKDLVVDPDYIRVTPGLLSLFGRSPLIFFKSGVFGGSIHGDCRFMDEQSVHADVRISGLKLESVNFLSEISQHRISGLMDGTMKIKSENSDVQTELDIVFSNITVSLARPVLGMTALQFDVVEADLSTTLRRIAVKACTLKGQDVDGEFTGDILIRQPYNMSVVKLNGFLKPKASFIKQAGKTLPIDFLMKNEPGAKGFPLKLTGTIQNPEIALR